MEHEPEERLRMFEESLKSLTDHQRGSAARLGVSVCASAWSEQICPGVVNRTLSFKYVCEVEYFEFLASIFTFLTEIIQCSQHGKLKGEICNPALAEWSLKTDLGRYRVKY